MSEENKKFIPKIKTDVKILVENSHFPNDYTVFLRIGEGTEKSETLYEFLHTENRLFLPLINKNSNTFELMNVNNIIYIKETEKADIESERPVTLTLKNNTRLKVEIPEDAIKDRISDFLNTKSNFIEFITEDGFAIFINKYKIAMLQEKCTY